MRSTSLGPWMPPLHGDQNRCCLEADSCGVVVVVVIQADCLCFSKLEAACFLQFKCVKHPSFARFSCCASLGGIVSSCMYMPASVAYAVARNGHAPLVVLPRCVASSLEIVARVFTKAQERRSRARAAPHRAIAACCQGPRSRFSGLAWQRMGPQVQYFSETHSAWVDCAEAKPRMRSAEVVVHTCSVQARNNVVLDSSEAHVELLSLVTGAPKQRSIGRSGEYAVDVAAVAASVSKVHIPRQRHKGVTSSYLYVALTALRRRP